MLARTSITIITNMRIRGTKEMTGRYVFALPSSMAAVWGGKNEGHNTGQVRSVLVIQGQTDATFARVVGTTGRSKLHD